MWIQDFSIQLIDNERGVNNKLKMKWVLITNDASDIKCA